MIEVTPQLHATILEFNGVFRFAARKMIVERLETRRPLWSGSSPTFTPCRTAIARNAVIEPYLTDQWYVDAATLRKAGHGGSAKRGRTTFVPKNWETTYFPLDGEHPAMVHLAPALVGTPHPRLVWP